MSMHAPRRTAGLAAAVTVLAAASGALAADGGPKARAAQLQDVVDCRKIADPSERLACYDAATAKLDEAEKKGDVVVVDKAQVREARRAAFGFDFKMPSFMTRGETPEELDKITAQVASARRSADGKWIIKLEDGAVWRQTDDKKLFRDPRPGSTVEIRTAALGSYFMKVDGQTQMRVHRDN